MDKFRRKGVGDESGVESGGGKGDDDGSFVGDRDCARPKVLCDRCPELRVLERGRSSLCRTISVGCHFRNSLPVDNVFPLDLDILPSREV